MKRLCCMIAAILLFGCAAPLPLDVPLDLAVKTQEAGRYQTIVAVQLTGSDKRSDREIIVYQVKNDPPVSVFSRTEPQEVIKQQLAAALRQQGLSLVDEAPVHLVLEIEQLLATVTRPKLLYDTKAVSRIVLTAHHAGNSLVKRYTKEATRSSATRPEPAELAALLGEQLSRAVEQILEDQEIQAIIAGR